jgi:NADPH2:quinone reductase
MISFGNASGPVPPIDPLSLSSKCLKVCRPTSGGYIQTKEEFDYYAGELMKLLSKGELKITISKIYDLKDAGQAHSDLEVLDLTTLTDFQGRKTTGKLLLRIS